MLGKKLKEKPQAIVNNFVKLFHRQKLTNFSSNEMEEKPSCLVFNLFDDYYYEKMLPEIKTSTSKTLKILVKIKHQKKKRTKRI